MWRGDECTECIFEVVIRMYNELQVICYTVTLSLSLVCPQKSFEELLNLEAFACEEISIQFAAVNKYGHSLYSPGTSLFVYGGELLTVSSFVSIIHTTCTYIHFPNCYLLVLHHNLPLTPHPPTPRSSYPAPPTLPLPSHLIPQNQVQRSQRIQMSLLLNSRC